MAEALVEEINHPDTGLVSRDFLRPELQTLTTELQTLRADLIGTDLAGRADRVRDPGCLVRWSRSWLRFW